MSSLSSSISLFRYYKDLGEKAMAQVTEEQLFSKASQDSNSIGNIVKHLWGNMLSRWTDFMSSDGEKTWRERDAEFEDTLNTREALQEKWEAGWQVLFDTLDTLNEADMDKTVTIRGERHTAEDAIMRQLAHYAYHVGQIVYIARNLKGQGWQSLSIPKGQSKAYNEHHSGRISSSGESIWEK